MKNFTFHKVLCMAALMMLLQACHTNPEEYREAAANPEFLHQSMKKITDVIVHDIFSPPVATRIYAYSSLAAYEVLVHDYPAYKSLAGQITDFKETPKPNPDEVYCFPLASIQACLKVGQTFIFSEEKIEQFRKDIHQQFRDLGIPDDVFERSVAYGEKVGDHVLAWSGSDNYKETRTFPKFTITDEPGRWQPTPPDYMDGIEPSWMKIRPMILDSCNQFAPPPPPPFDTAKSSEFYVEMMRVYETGVNLTDEQLAIAKFWDCNPYVSHHKGHVMFATKKISPGGHWLGIAAIAAKLADADIMKTAQTYTLTSVALFDAFISCWDEKYRSNLVRPETVINRYVDPDWRPILQTPPFPEYTSGHSVISKAASTVLTSIYGEPFGFVDSVEVEFGLPARSFDSFHDASDEAAISRMYGGIHYWPACSVGVIQGKKVGDFIVDNLKFKGEGMENNEAITQLTEGS